MTRLKDSGAVTPAGVSGGQYSEKKNTAAAEGIVTSPVDAVAARFAKRVYTEDDIRDLRGGRPQVFQPFEPEPHSDVYHRRYPTVGAAMTAEYDLKLESGGYQAMTSQQRASVKAIGDAVIGIRDHSRKAKKSYEVTELPTGNAAVYLDVAYSNSPFDEVFARIEVAPDGDVLSSHLAFMQGGKWAEITDADDVKRFFLGNPL